MATVTVANGSGGRNADLASKLRACAYHVERNEFNPILYQALALLHAYAGEHSSTEPAPDAPAHVQAGVSPNLSGKSGGGDVPFDDTERPKAGVSGIPTGAFDDVDIEGPTKSQEEHHHAAAKEYGLKDFATDIGKDINKLGKKFSKATGFSHSDDTSKEDWVKREREREMERRGEGEWCEGTVGGGKGSSSGTSAQEAHPSATTASGMAAASAVRSGSHAVQSRPRPAAKPCFQRPVNKSSNLIANGWIEQQRRSKLRVVWKDILASLVEGRRPGEETTLWIQRQVTNATTGKAELEALHQIPMKWLEDVTYIDFYGDHRFSLKIFNVSDEFQFRTSDKDSAESWVATLRSARDASLAKNKAKGGEVAGLATGDRPTAGEARQMDEGLQDEPGANPRTASGGRDAGGGATATATTTGAAAAHAHVQQHAAAPRPPPPPPAATEQPRRTIKELRAIAHGQGIDTRGMERADLERIAARYAPAPTVPTAPSSRSASPVPSFGAAAAQQAAAQKQQAAARAEAERKRRAAEEDQQRAAAAAAEQRRREEEQKAAAARRAAAVRQEETALAAAAEEERRRQAEFAERQAAERRKAAADEADRQRQATAAREAQARAQAAEAERQRQAAAAAEVERKRKEAEAQAQYQRQQAAWQQQQQQQAEWQRQAQQQAQKQAQQQEEARKRAWEQQAAQQRAQQQAWQRQQAAQQQQQHAHAHAQPPPPHPQQAHAQPQPPPPPPPHQQQQHSGPGSPINTKYAQAATQGNGRPSSEDAQQAAITRIKRDILVNWALLPPAFQMLKPIDHLVASFHAHLPPAHGVPGHDYFKKFKPIPHSDLVLGGAMGNAASEDKLKKAVRKIRFFLHPDKLPRDLGPEQSFAVKMLWDVTSDAWEEFCKHKEELDWIH